MADRYYEVKPGDNSDKIRNAHGVQLSRFQQANPGINLQHIRPGQRLVIPDDDRTFYKNTYKVDLDNIPGLTNQQLGRIAGAQSSWGKQLRTYDEDTGKKVVAGGILGMQPETFKGLRNSLPKQYADSSYEDMIDNPRLALQAAKLYNKQQNLRFVRKHKRYPTTSQQFAMWRWGAAQSPVSQRGKNYAKWVSSLKPLNIQKYIFDYERKKAIELNNAAKQRAAEANPTVASAGMHKQQSLYKHGFLKVAEKLVRSGKPTIQTAQPREQNKNPNTVKQNDPNSFMNYTAATLGRPVQYNQWIKASGNGQQASTHAPNIDFPVYGPLQARQIVYGANNKQYAIRDHYNALKARLAANGAQVLPEQIDPRNSVPIRVPHFFEPSTGAQIQQPLSIPMMQKNFTGQRSPGRIMFDNNVDRAYYTPGIDIADLTPEQKQQLNRYPGVTIQGSRTNPGNVSAIWQEIAHYITPVTEAAENPQYSISPVFFGGDRGALSKYKQLRKRYSLAGRLFSDPVDSPIGDSYTNNASQAAQVFLRAKAALHNIGVHTSSRRAAQPDLETLYNYIDDPKFIQQFNSRGGDIEKLHGLIETAAAHIQRAMTAAKQYGPMSPQAQQQARWYQQFVQNLKSLFLQANNSPRQSYYGTQTVYS